MVMNPDSVFSQLGHHGLISFSDYLFMLTILASESWLLIPKTAYLLIFGLHFQVYMTSEKCVLQCTLMEWAELRTRQIRDLYLLAYFVSAVEQ